jgi:hypothetical protein
LLKEYWKLDELLIDGLKVTYAVLEKSIKMNII